MKGKKNPLFYVAITNTPNPNATTSQVPSTKAWLLLAGSHMQLLARNAAMPVLVASPAAPTQPAPRGDKKPRAAAPHTHAFCGGYRAVLKW